MRDEVTTTRELTRPSLRVAFAATLGLMTSSPSIVQASLGLFVVPVTHAFGIGRGPFGLMMGASMLLGAAMTPIAGQAMDRYGARRIVLPGIAAFGVVQMLLGGVPRSVPLLVILVLLQGILSALVTPLAYVKVLSLWFYRRRGLMLGTCAAIGIGAGSGVSAGLVGALMHQWGWRAAYLGTGIYVLVVGAAVIWPLLREPRLAAPGVNDAATAELPGLTLHEAIRTRAFFTMLLLVVGSIGGIAVMMGHGPALLAGRGLNIGPYYLVCAAVGSLVGQLASGVMLDRIDSPKVGLVFALATMLGGGTVLYFGTSAAIVLPAAVIQGLGQGAETGLASYYGSRFFGLRAYGSIFGLVMTVVTLAAGVFPTIAGYVFDRTGSYHAVIPMVDMLLVIPPVAIMLMPRYRFRAIPAR